MHINDQFDNSFNNGNSSGKFKNFLSVPKIIFAIFGIIVLVEIIYAVRVLTAPTPAPPAALKQVVQKEIGGKISLTVPKTSYEVNETIPVSVMVDTGTHEVSGIDLIVQYDPKILEASSAGLIKGEILDEYPLLSVDAKKGLISISGISSLKRSGFAGQGQFALINFTSKAPGQSSLVVEFKGGATTASNLVEANTSKNILDEARNLEISVK